jgi:hypothetical protein
MRSLGREALNGCSETEPNVPWWRKSASTVRHVGIEVDDALELSEQLEI